MFEKFWVGWGGLRFGGVGVLVRWWGLGWGRGICICWWEVEGLIVYAKLCRGLNLLALVCYCLDIILPIASLGIVGEESSFKSPVSALLKRDCIINCLSFSSTFESLSKDK